MFMYENFNYLDDRVDKQLQHYKKKENWLKFFYTIIFFIQVAAAASLPLITLLSDTLFKNIIISLCGVIILISQLLFSTINFKEQIQDCKEIIFLMETEKYLYLNHSGKYAQKTSDEKIDLFVGEIEKSFNGFSKKTLKPKRKREIEFN
ncbi:MULTISPECIES: DUF4231 domain-containing protein [Vagococcus]|uniref:SMODS and SLOG-associating 2TM effector domain-containing protein n=1 Tax=Vagococcus fluvialis bH819 TaxID=1255619 RepID=A0A1X6WM97_9ENTE|nr:MULTISPECIES: DUF4231 domain-containing protein [Vagococcus]SLM85454.1 hypothetical protein FM121_05100 [Vagococcus fluvialis bH819]HCM89253.1 DUF4231 domain-containing protein [Vagococcus sp.]